jgi:hypothetical protein
MAASYQTPYKQAVDTRSHDYRAPFRRKWASSWFGYGFASCGFGMRSVHERPNTIVRPRGRALAEYSS